MNSRKIDLIFIFRGLQCFINIKMAGVSAWSCHTSRQLQRCRCVFLSESSDQHDERTSRIVTDGLSNDEFDCIEFGLHHSSHDRHQAVSRTVVHAHLADCFQPSLSKVHVINVGCFLALCTVYFSRLFVIVLIIHFFLLSEDACILYYSTFPH